MSHVIILSCHDLPRFNLEIELALHDVCLSSQLVLGEVAACHVQSRRAVLRATGRFLCEINTIRRLVRMKRVVAST